MGAGLEQYHAVLEEVFPRMQPPRAMVVMNSSGDVLQPGCDPAVVKEMLKRELVSTVFWEASVLKIVKELKIDQLYEVGPGKKLKDLVRRADERAGENTKAINL